jgi:hypothetical protein
VNSVIAKIPSAILQNPEHAGGRWLGRGHAAQARAIGCGSVAQGAGWLGRLSGPVGLDDRPLVG